MSIASRITAMTEHIDDIYDTVELTGVDTTGLNKNLVNVPNTLKDGFVDIINNGTDTLYENFPKVSQTGEEPTLNGVYEAPMRVELNGNTEQDSYTGKNLFNYNIIDVSTVTIDNDGTILISGTEASNGYTLTNKTLSQLCPSLQVGDTVYIYIESDFTERQYMYSSDGSFWRNGGSKTITQEMLNANIILYGGYQTTSHLKIMITNQLETSFEPYVGGIASPNPDYPQDIRVVKGNNTIKVTGKNLCSNAENFSGGAVYLYFDPKKINKTVTISLISDVDAENSNIFLFGGNTNLGNLGSSNRINLVANQKAYATITIPDDIYNQMLNYDAANFSLYKPGAGHDTSKAPLEAQIENNLSYTGYQPYQEQTYPLNLGTTELCKIGDYQDYFTRDNKGIWGITRAIGKVVLDGSEDESWSYNSGNEVFVSSNLVNYMLVTFTPFCNYYTGKPSITGYSQIPNNCISFLNSSTNNRLIVKNTTYNTLSVFKTWLSNNPVTVYYVLETPTYEEITATTLIEQLEDLKTAKSVEGQTNITQTNEELPFILDVSGLKKD